MDNKQKQKTISLLELSAFCMQISLMLESAIPLDEGVLLMAEDSQSKAEKIMLKTLAEKLEFGSGLGSALESVGGFPDYVIFMTRIGEESGNLDKIMDSLAKYYKKEDDTRKTIKEALTYPLIMIFMMLIILYILMTKVMPIFEGVFTQLGTALSPLAKSAISLGGLFSGILIMVLAAMVILSGIITLLVRKNIHIPLMEKLTQGFLKRGKISIALGISRFCGVMSMTLKSGMDIGEALVLAESVAGNSYIEAKASQCATQYGAGGDFVDALKKTGFFTGFYQQMLVIGGRTGHLDLVLDDLSERYNDEVERRISGAIAKFEPTMIAVLSVAVGLILLAVMLPLIGMMASMG